MALFREEFTLSIDHLDDMAGPGGDLDVRRNALATILDLAEPIETRHYAYGGLAHRRQWVSGTRNGGTLGAQGRRRDRLRSIIQQHPPKPLYSRLNPCPVA